MSSPVSLSSNLATKRAPLTLQTVLCVATSTHCVCTTTNFNITTLWRHKRNTNFFSSSSSSFFYACFGFFSPSSAQIAAMDFSMDHPGGREGGVALGLQRCPQNTRTWTVSLWLDLPGCYTASVTRRGRGAFVTIVAVTMKRLYTAWIVI